MPYHKLGALLMASGLLTLAIGIGGLSAPTAAQAQTGPGVRPTLEPTKSPRRQSAPETFYGHITGTVIDTTTGQPMPGIAVRVGDATVLTDADGNYDHWLPVGAYTIMLVMDPALGTPAEAQAIVEVTAGGRTLHHLSYASPDRAAPQTVSVASVPTVAPALDPAAIPARLPVTAAADLLGWAWLPAGLALVAAGGLCMRPARRVRHRAVAAISAANTDLLGTLLAPAPREDELLSSLLRQTKSNKTHPGA